jgi:DNA topoisomerase I
MSPTRYPESPGIAATTAGCTGGRIGSVITDAGELAWIDAIKIPPGWTQVWISPGPMGTSWLPAGMCVAASSTATTRAGARCATGRSTTGWATSRGRCLAYVSGSEQDLDLPELPRDRVLGAVIRLMDLTLIRIGNEEYARQNQSYGLTTLRHDHVRFQDRTTVLFEFRAKSGKEQRVRLSDPRLAAIVHACNELPGQELFAYVDDDGRIVDVGSTKVNAYLRAITRAIFTAKDFRTWRGTGTAAEALDSLGPPRSPTDAKRKINAAIDAAAERLNNTRAVCRKSYVHPRVVPESYVDGSLTGTFTNARKRPRLSHAESAVLLLLRQDKSALGFDHGK